MSKREDRLIKKGLIPLHYCKHCELILHSWKRYSSTEQYEDIELDNNGYQEVVDVDIEDRHIMEEECHECNKEIDTDMEVWVTKDILGYIITESKNTGLPFILTEDEEDYGESILEDLTLFKSRHFEANLIR